MLNLANDELTQPLRLRQSNPTNLRLNIDSISVATFDGAEGHGRSRTIQPIQGVLPSFTPGYIEFPSASGGSIVAVGLTLAASYTLTVSSGNWIKVGIYLNTSGQIALTFGVQGASESAAGAPGLVAGARGIGYVSMQNSVGTIQNVTGARIYQYAGGSGLDTVSLTTNVSGILPIANGGTNISTLGTALQVLRVNAGGTALEYATTGGDVSGPASSADDEVPVFDGTTGKLLKRVSTGPARSLSNTFQQTAASGTAATFDALAGASHSYFGYVDVSSGRGFIGNSNAVVTAGNVFSFGFGALTAGIWGVDSGRFDSRSVWRLGNPADIGGNTFAGHQFVGKTDGSAVATGYVGEIKTGVVTAQIAAPVTANTFSDSSGIITLEPGRWRIKFQGTLRIGSAGGIGGVTISQCNVVLATTSNVQIGAFAASATVQNNNELFDFPVTIDEEVNVTDLGGTTYKVRIRSDQGFASPNGMYVTLYNDGFLSSGSITHYNRITATRLL